MLGLLPATIDTPMNRKYMSDADFSSWTKVRERDEAFHAYVYSASECSPYPNHFPYVVQVEDIAAKILEWSETPTTSRPASGHLVTVFTQNNKNAWEDVGNPFL